MKVMFADIEPTLQGPVFGQYYSPTAGQMASYDSSLSNIASSYRIFTEGSIDKMNGNIFGLTQATPDPTFPVIGSLAPEFFDPLQSPLYESQRPEAIECTLLLLAMTCVHELANVIYMYRSIPQNILKLSLGQQLDPVPYFSATDPVVELGEALECYLFGGTLHFLGAPDDGSLEASGDLGLAWIPWVSPDPAMTENSLQQDAEPLIWAVSARSIGRMFDLDTSMITVA
jgi:hypothetical protein